MTYRRRDWLEQCIPRGPPRRPALGPGPQIGSLHRLVRPARAGFGRLQPHRARQLGQAQSGLRVAAGTLVIAGTVVAHGPSASPLAERYSRAKAAKPPSLAEMPTPPGGRQADAGPAPLGL